MGRCFLIGVSNDIISKLHASVPYKQIFPFDIDFSNEYLY